MLTNTVGVMIFILVFTVLGAGHAFLVKRLPLEHATKKKTVDVLCIKNRVFLVPDSVVDEFMKPIVRVGRSEGLGDRLLRTLKNRTYESQDLILRGQGSRHRRGFTDYYDLGMAIEPKADGGVSISALLTGGTQFHIALKDSDKKAVFFRFLVKPDSIEAFVAARDLVLQAGFDAAWSPEKSEGPFLMALSGGREALPQ